MSTNKRYFWLKLHDDFFTSKRIKKLRRLAGGDTLTIIYLKMQLIAIKTEGIIKYTGLEDTFAEELALDLDEDVDNVKLTLAYLQNCGLIETNGEEYFIPYAIANTGSETAATQRCREWRDKQKVLQCNEKVLQCNTIATPLKQNGNAEIEIDKDKDIDIDIDNNKTSKKTKQTKKENLFVEFSKGDEELLRALKGFEEMRNKLNKPLTAIAKERMLKKLTELSEDKETQIAILYQSIDKDWLGVFPLKKEYSNALTEHERIERERIKRQEEFRKLAEEYQ